MTFQHSSRSMWMESNWWDETRFVRDSREPEACQLTVYKRPKQPMYMRFSSPFRERMMLCHTHNMWSCGTEEGLSTFVEQVGWQWTGIIWKFLPDPKPIHNSANPRLAKWPSAMTTMSLSTVLMYTLWWPRCAPSSRWRKMRVSAYWWLQGMMFWRSGLREWCLTARLS